MDQQLKFEEVEKILSWREMRPGVNKFHGIEYRGTNDYDKPIGVITLETEEGVKTFHSPASLYWALKQHVSSNMKRRKLLKRNMTILSSSFQNEPISSLVIKFSK